MLPKPILITNPEGWMQEFARIYEQIRLKMEKRLQRRLADFRRFSWAFAVAFVVLGLLTTFVWWEDFNDARYPIAVVASDNIPLRTGNGDSYPAVEINRVAVKLNRGVEARVRSRKDNGWVQLEIGDQLIGWVPAKAVLIDEPNF